jgi:hypothetical protein
MTIDDGRRRSGELMDDHRGHAVSIQRLLVGVVYPLQFLTERERERERERGSEGARESAPAREREREREKMGGERERLYVH